MIFATGHSRGGTTWLGDLLGLAADAGYIFEPLTTDRHPRTSQSDLLAQELAGARTWMYPWPPSDPRQRVFADAVAQHLRELAEYYFPQGVETLVIKQPDIEYLRLLDGVLNPDHVVYIERHPLPILNSYDSGNLYDGWNVAEQFDLCRAYVQSNAPVYQELLERAGSDPELRILALCCIKHDLAQEWASDPRFIIVSYERLAERGVSELLELFRLVHLRPRPDAEMERYFWPTAAKTGFLDTEKNSAARAIAYLGELAPWQLSRAKAFLRETGQFDQDLPQQNLKQALGGVLAFVVRRLGRAEQRLRVLMSRTRRIVGSGPSTIAAHDQ